ncbi:MAG: DUF3592 domain-containing protein, partial [Acidobacteriota bacterium]
QSHQGIYFWLSFIANCCCVHADFEQIRPNHSSWVELPCSITSTSIKETVGPDGSTYWPDIRYSFQLDGSEYEGKRYSFRNATGDSRAANEVLQRYPVGDEITCWVDPDNPSQSVIDRSPGWFLLLGLAPIPIIAIGFGGLWFMSRL